MCHLDDPKDALQLAQCDRAWHRSVHAFADWAVTLPDDAPRVLFVFLAIPYDATKATVPPATEASNARTRN